ncbi:MAG: RnfABCDGE type electron transport complex subunit D [Bacillota bacterium]
MTNQFSGSGPHIENEDTIEKNMWSVIIALIPALIAGTYFFGYYALFLSLASGVSALLFEKIIIRSKRLIGDGSALLAGLLLGLTLPPTAPWWIAILGGFLTITIGKHLFGGLGNNIFNPALVARAILLLSFPAIMTDWISPIDGVSTATPLQQGAESIEYLELFLGNISGSIGETSALALIIGGIYLFLRDYIKLYIPLSFITGAMLTSYLFGQDPLFAILSGGIMFGAIYMTTDMVTSPSGKWAKMAYGLLGGFLTIFIRQYTPYPEGITFAILITNGISYLLDHLLERPHFGQVEEFKTKLSKITSLVLAAIVLAVLPFVFYEDKNEFPASLTYNHLQQEYPEAKEFKLLEKDDENHLYAARNEEETLGYLIYASRNGYKEAIESLSNLNLEGEITKVQIISENESPTLGTKIKEKDFLEQFNDFTVADSDSLTEEIDLISGATFSSQTLAKSIENGLQLFVKEQEESLVSGTYRGTAEGAQDDLTVEIKIENNEIVSAKVAEHNETRNLAEPAFEELTEELVDKQSTELDIISGATYSSEAFIEAANKALEKAKSDLETQNESQKFTGKAEGHKSTIEVSVSLDGEEITNIEVLSEDETDDLGDDAINTMIEKIIAEQSTDVDIVSGATNSSNALIEAVEKALEKSE